jgi:hypothetical protein
VSLFLSLSVCLSISLLKLEPVGPELLKFGPAELGPKIRPMWARTCSLFTKKPDPALLTLSLPLVINAKKVYNIIQEQTLANRTKPGPSFQL